MRKKPGLRFRIRYRILSCIRDIFDKAAVAAHRYHLRALERLFYSVTCICFHNIMELIFKGAGISAGKYHREPNVPVQAGRYRSRSVEPRDRQRNLLVDQPLGRRQRKRRRKRKSDAKKIHAQKIWLEAIDTGLVEMSRKNARLPCCHIPLCHKKSGKTGGNHKNRPGISKM